MGDFCDISIYFAIGAAATLGSTLSLSLSIDDQDSKSPKGYSPTNSQRQTDISIEGFSKPTTPNGSIFVMHGPFEAPCDTIIFVGRMQPMLLTTTSIAAAAMARAASQAEKEEKKISKEERGSGVATAEATRQTVADLISQIR